MVWYGMVVGGAAGKQKTVGSGSCCHFVLSRFGFTTMKINSQGVSMYSSSLFSTSSLEPIKTNNKNKLLKSGGAREIANPRLLASRLFFGRRALCFSFAFHFGSSYCILLLTRCIVILEESSRTGVNLLPLVLCSLPKREH